MVCVNQRLYICADFLRKTQMKKLFFFIAAFAGMQIYFSCTNQGVEDKTGLVATAEMNISIEGMTCASGCAKKIEKTVAALKGVTYSSVNFEEQTAVFKYDDSKTSEKEILETIAKLNEGQYKVTKVEVKIEKKEGGENNENEVKAVEENLVKDTLV